MSDLASALAALQADLPPIRRTRGGRLLKVSQLAGRDVDSVNDLSLVEGRMVRERMGES